MAVTKGSDNEFPSVLFAEQGGDPATPAAGTQRLFVDSADGLLKLIDDTGTVTAVGGGSSDLDAIITASSGQDIADALAGAAAPDAGNVFATMADVGGSSLDWTLDVNQSGASFTGWAANTSDGGTWSSNGTEIIQTSTSASVRRANKTAQTPLGWPMILQAECQVVTAVGGNNRVGIGITDGTSGGFGYVAYLDSGADVVAVEIDSSIAVASYAHTLNTATWYTLRLVFGAYWVSVYVDGTFKGNAMLNVGTTAAPRNSAINSEFLSLISYGASVKWRNIKVWSLSTGAP